MSFLHDAGRSGLARFFVLVCITISVRPRSAGAEGGASARGGDAAVVAAIEAISPSVVRIEAIRGGGVSNGCGTIIDGAGLALTCQHVVAGARQIDIILSDGRRARAELVGGDARSDLAVIRVAVSGLKPAAWGDADGLLRGRMVIALGSPAGVVASSQPSAAVGFVAAIGRPEPSAFGADGSEQRGVLVQTSALVRRGDSGGPLIDLEARLVGVVSAVASDSERGLAPAMATPMTAAMRRIVERLGRGEKIERGDIGIRIGPARAAGPRPPSQIDEAGAIVVWVDPGGPADQAGLHVGDVIVRVDGHSVGSADGLEEQVSEAEAGSRLAVVVRRDGGELPPLSVVTRRESLSSRPRTTLGEGREWRGARLSPMPDSLRRQMAAPAGSLMVVRVASDSAAARAGLEPGSVIVRVAGRTLDTIESGGPLLDDASGDVMLGLASGGTKLVRAK